MSYPLGPLPLDPFIYLIRKDPILYNRLVRTSSRLRRLLLPYRNEVASTPLTNSDLINWIRTRSDSELIFIEFNTYPTGQDRYQPKPFRFIVLNSREERYNSDPDSNRWLPLSNLPSTLRELEDRGYVLWTPMIRRLYEYRLSDPSFVCKNGWSVISARIQNIITYSNRFPTEISIPYIYSVLYSFLKEFIPYGTGRLGDELFKINLAGIGTDWMRENLDFIQRVERFVQSNNN